MYERTTKDALAATSGRPARGKTARRNITRDTGEKATYTLEDSGSAQPSRKSTRKTANRAKADASFRRRQTRKVRSPKARATKAKAAAKRVRARR